MILEGAMIVIATSCLTFLHPGISFQGAWTAANFTFRKGKNGDVEKSTDSIGLESVDNSTFPSNSAVHGGR